MSVTKNPLYVNDTGGLNKATALNLDTWLINLQLRVDELETKIIEKDTIINELRTEINLLKTTHSTTATSAANSGIAWSNLFKNTTNESLNVIMAKVSNENREKEKIENNITISGVTDSEDRTETVSNMHDEDEVDKILAVLELSRDDVKKQSRIKRNPPRTPTATTATISKEPMLIRLEFKEKHFQQKALQNAKKLKDEEEMGKIYINPDRTILERLADQKLRQERNLRNQSLENESQGRLRYSVDANSRKYYWGIRGGTLKRIFINE